MLGIEHYGLFLVSGILLNITPGSDTLYIFGRSLSQGKAAGMMSVFGIISGAMLHTLFAALGLSVILMHSAVAFSVIKWAGAAYLVYMGIKAVRSKTPIGGVSEGRPKEELRRIYLQGLLTNLLNPKVALFYLAFLPQFVSPGHGYGPLPFLLLGLTFITTGTLWCSFLVVASDLARRHLLKGKISLYLNKVTGLIFISLGIKLLSATRNG
ncbi:LysE family translocator [Gorillibacterium sp. sgz5001074]|uniref:LysE family translocator n=1 Tax=Gorillibacterium sp. sgz5001074 TaxID=3446695 RepID=UPI003F668229